jgi:hypothetical protein
LVVNGGFDSDTAWSKGGGWSIANGTATHTGGVSYLSQSILEPNKQYKVKIKVIQASGNNFVQIYMGNSPASVLIQNVGEYEYIFTSQSVQTLGFALRGALDIEIDNVSVKEYFGQKVVPNSGCGSLLLEPQSTNLITYSEDFSQGWIFNSSVIVNQAISPSGDNTANELPNSLQRIAKNSVSTINTDNTISLYVKLIDSDYFLLSSYSSPTDWVAVTFDITNGTITNQGIGSGSSVLDTKANIEKVGNGYCRISIVNNTSASAGINLQRVDNPTHSYTNYGVASDTYANGYAYIWGAQVEQLSFPTSYIPTNGSSATRLADVCNNAGSSDLINSTEGVLYAEVDFSPQDNRTVSIKSNTNDRVQIVSRPNSGIRFFISDSGGLKYNDYSNTLVDGFNKIALSWDVNGFYGFVNGSKIHNISTAINLQGLNQVSFDSGLDDFYGNVKSVVVFKEALTNDELEGLTGEGYDTFNALALANNYTII